MSVINRAQASSRFDARGSIRDGAEVRQRQRELDGRDVLGEPDAAAFVYGFLPVTCDCPPDRCVHRPEMIRTSRRPHVPLHDAFRLTATLPQPCGHGASGITADGCDYCEARASQTDRVAAHRGGDWHLMADDLDSLAGDLAA